MQPSKLRPDHSEKPGNRSQFPFLTVLLSLGTVATGLEYGLRRYLEVFRAGGFDQVRLDAGSDLEALDQLDQKLWVALACPTTGLEFDSKTLALIDSDKDG
jgi:hypothetical protein